MWKLFTRKSASSERGRDFKPVIEALEDRCLPSGMPPLPPIFSHAPQFIQQNGGLFGSLPSHNPGPFGNFLQAFEGSKTSFLNQIEQSVQKLVTDVRSGASMNQIVTDAFQVVSTAENAIAAITGLNVADQTPAGQTPAADVFALLTSGQKPGGFF